MNTKCMIILTLVANAHVHGADQNSNTLGKRIRQAETEKNAQNKRQKTDQQMGASINTLSRQGAREDEGPDHSGNEDSYMPWKEICQRCDSRHAEPNVYNGEEAKADRTARKPYPKHTANQGLGSNFRRFSPEGLSQDQLLRHMDCEPRGPGVGDKNNDESHPHNNCASTLKKRKRQEEEKQNAQNKRQKTTNQAIVEQIDTSLQSEGRHVAKPNTLPKKNVNSILSGDAITKIMEFLHPKDNRNMMMLSKTMRALLKKESRIVLLPERYCNTKKEWVPLRTQDKTDDCFVYSAKTLYVPNGPYTPREIWDIAIQMDSICKNKKVDRMTIDAPQRYCDQTPQKEKDKPEDGVRSGDQTPQWVKLEEKDNPEDCFVYFKETLCVPNQPNAIQTLQTIGLDKEVNHIVTPFSGQHSIPDGWWHSINALFTNPVNDNNSLTFKVSGTDDDEISDDDISQAINDLLGNLSNVKHLIIEGKTGNEYIDIPYPDEIDNKCVTIRNIDAGNIENDYCYIIVFDGAKITFKNGSLTATSNYEIHCRHLRHGSITARGPNAKIIVDNDRITGTSDTKVEHTEYDDNDDCQREIIAEGKRIQDAGIEKTELTRPQIIATCKDITATSNGHVWSKKYTKDGKVVCQETSAHGDAKITIKDDDITGTADNGVLHQTLFRNGTLHQQISANGATTFAIKDDGGIKATSNTEMQYLKNDKNETEVHHALIQGNSELSLARAGKVLATKGEHGVIHNGKRLANHDRLVTIDLKGLKK